MTEIGSDTLKTQPLKYIGRFVFKSQTQTLLSLFANLDGYFEDIFTL